MPASTPVLALPYPLGTDPVQRGDDDIRALAERIEAKLPRGQLASAGNVANQTIGSLVILTGLATGSLQVSAGRLLVVEVDLMVNANNAGYLTVQLTQDGVMFAERSMSLGAGSFGSVRVSALVAGLAAGTHSWYAQASFTGGTAIVYGTPAQNRATLTVRDVGAVAGTTRPGVDVDGPGIDQELPDEQPEGRPGQELPEHPAPKGTDDDDDTDA